MLEIIFWASTALVVYTFVVYPIFTMLVGILFGRRASNSDYTPAISVIIAACNEEKYMHDRLRRLLELDYPADRMQVIVVTDDGSRDRTVEITRSLADRGVVHLLSPACGKNVCLDLAVSNATGDVLIFKDASGIFGNDTLRRLAAHFRDPRVGCVGGVLLYQHHKEIGAIERLYWRIEESMRTGAEVLGYLPAVPGGIHAMRRSVYRPVENHIVRDVVDPIQAIVQGCKVVREKRAVCHEVAWTSVANVFRNRIRATSRAWAAVAYCVRELARARRFQVLFQLFSHKICRLFVWCPLLVCLVSSLILALDSSFFLLVASAQLLFHGVCILTLVAARLGYLIPLASIPSFFILNAAAMAVGTIKYLFGNRTETWRSLNVQTPRAA